MSPLTLFIPDLHGDLHQGKPPAGNTKVLYYGPGSWQDSTVFALINGEGTAAATDYMWQASTEAYIRQVFRTATVGPHSTYTGNFDIMCNYQYGMHKQGQCSMVYMPSLGATSAYTVFLTTPVPRTTMTPIQGLFQQQRQKTASGPKDIFISALPGPNGHAQQNAAAAVLPSICIGRVCVPSTLVPVALLLSGPLLMLLLSW